MKDYMSTIIFAFKNWIKKEVKNSVADWNQNDPNMNNYVKNRTHWVDADGTIHQIDTKYIPNIITQATKEYVNTSVANLVNSAPETLDTLGELAAAMQENVEVTEALDTAVTKKLDISVFAEYLTNTALMLHSPNGTKFSITVGNDGVLIATEIPNSET